jgi:hypothetical protein
MNEMINSEICERNDDLISFLYGELNDREARSFEQHRRACPQCEAEVAAFGQVRQSVQRWRDESLSLTIPALTQPQTVRPASNRSAWAAIRAFLEISPLWMKGAAAFAAVLFCVLSALAMARLFEDPQVPRIVVQERSDEEFRIAVDSKANLLAAQSRNETLRQSVSAPKEREQPVVDNNNGSATAVARKAKPLSRSERNQLAADLRLVSNSDDDEDSLHLLGDRINR